LSYTWDAQKPCKPFICDGYTLLITPNCELALLRLRRKSTYRLLWIDSISIDQSSTEERNEQVSIMAEIYRLSMTVLVWLGKGNARSDRIMMLLNEFDSKRPRNAYLPHEVTAWLVEAMKKVEGIDLTLLQWRKFELT
jgi:hypothetical protein